jgi:capsule polysaccharide export protein KpsE/RkpR
MIPDVVEKMEKANRIPRSVESIEKGALALDLKDRVELKNKLIASIDAEVKEMEEKLQAAKSIVG